MRLFYSKYSNNSNNFILQERKNKIINKKYKYRKNYKNNKLISLYKYYH